MEDVSADSRVGEVLDGRYRIIEPLASGGMGVVYRAERVGLGRFVAVKFLSPEGATSDASIKRFEREARAMSRLDHPHVVSVMDFGVAGTPYIVMEYVTGRPLHELIELGPVDARRAIDIMRQLVGGLAHAHGHGIIHRDIKPANVMLSEATGTGDYVRILDFGLAKLKGATALSSSHIVVGTPSYMAPEQARGRGEDGRSDLYAAGVLFFELLKGHKPYCSDDPLTTLRMHQHDPVPPLGELKGATSELAPAIQGVVHRAMAKKPAARFQSALEMAGALTELTDRSARGKDRRRRKRTTDVGRAKTIPIESADLAAFDEPDDPAREPEPAVPLPDLELDAEPSSPRTESAAPEPRKKSRVGSLLVLLVLAAAAAGGYRWWDRRDQRAPSVERPPPIQTTAVTADAAPVAELIDASLVLHLPDAGLDAAAEVTDAGAADPDEELESESVDAVDAGAPDAAAPLPPRPETVSRWADVKAHLARGEQDAAVIGLRKLVREHPKNAFYKLRLAHLYFERTAWTLALKLYRQALRLKPRYKRYKSVNTNAIRALGAKSTRWRARRLIVRTIGRRIARPHLRREARINKSPVVRRRAAALLKRLR